MFVKKFKIFIIFSALILGFSVSALAEVLEPRTKPQDIKQVEDLQKNVESTPLTQEQFAVELVKIMEIENLLPEAALASDCTALLERLGIAPLKGWRNKELLSREDYLVIIGKAQGKEGLVHKRAVAVEEKNVEIINQKWQEAHDKTGQWPSLGELLNNKEYFPSGAPQSPYGLHYRDANGDHKVDSQFLPGAGLIELREFLSSK